MFCCGGGAVRDGLSALAPPRSHPDLPRRRYPPPARPAPKGGSLSGRAAGYLSPSLACARPHPPPKGAHVSIPLVCASFPNIWLNSHTTKVK